MNNKIYIALFVLFIGLGYSLYNQFYPTENKEITELNNKVKQLDSLNNKMFKKDSLLNIRIDSFKKNYATKKKKYEKDKTIYDSNRGSIDNLPNF